MQHTECLYVAQQTKSEIFKTEKEKINFQLACFLDNELLQGTSVIIITVVLNCLFAPS